MSRHPPELIDAGPVLLRRALVEDAAAVACADAESLDHLRPWMPWATNEAATADAQRDRLIDAAARWEDGTSYDYLMATRAESGVVGACGLHRRVSEGGIELGYWVHAWHTGRGYARAAISATCAAGSSAAPLSS